MTTTTPDTVAPTRQKPTILVTVQFAVGGLFDAVPTSDLIHLNANYSETSRYTLCGIDMFPRDRRGPGFSRGGGVTGPDMRHVPCPTCRVVAANRYPDLTVDRDMFKLDWSRPTVEGEDVPSSPLSYCTVCGWSAWSEAELHGGCDCPRWGDES
jgi:hypothetical protein